ncbi:hypothetical protein L1987_54991 [Smallanthus sonchifolius]|uniref:Uncharacterized protein n=1 Tax=Smallanthus sonchifolius TaxID=185202 RepID=A0ACB9E924_9ASTR|nr:hypothetical protein L1987_54991 [Smallanthus sonchifolius]
MSSVVVTPAFLSFLRGIRLCNIWNNRKNNDNGVRERRDSGRARTSSAQSFAAVATLGGCDAGVAAVMIASCAVMVVATGQFVRRLCNEKIRKTAQHKKRGQKVVFQTKKNPNNGKLESATRTSTPI